MNTPFGPELNSTRTVETPPSKGALNENSEGAPNALNLVQVRIEALLSSYSIQGGFALPRC